MIALRFGVGPPASVCSIRPSCHYRYTAHRGRRRVPWTRTRCSVPVRSERQGGSRMDWGRRHRLSRIFDPRDGRTNMLAVDHGYFLGPTHGMEQPAEAIPPLLPYADALMVTRGLLRATIDPAPVKAIVLRASGGPSVAGPALEDELITTSVEDAIRMDAAAVTTQVFVGSAWERQSVANLSALINEAGRFEIPV